MEKGERQHHHQHQQAAGLRRQLRSRHRLRSQRGLQPRAFVAGGRRHPRVTHGHRPQLPVTVPAGTYIPGKRQPVPGRCLSRTWDHPNAHPKRSGWAGGHAGRGQRGMGLHGAHHKASTGGEGSKRQSKGAGTPTEPVTEAPHSARGAPIDTGDMGWGGDGFAAAVPKPTTNPGRGGWKGRE